ncbi:MAG: hypothetical protein DSN69_07065 [Nitrosopumilus sp. YT1]|nr:MAG: hypothetical protein DSN69_07065 [Nitrosopumilus sp. YT1]
MKPVKILAISDTALIPVYRRMVDNLHPDIVVLAGDYDEGIPFFEDTSQNYFYDFLRHTGTKSKVLVIQGNHDDPKWSDSTSHYSIHKINSIKGCNEISGKSIKINGLKFLGIDYDSSRINANLLPFLEKHGNGVDVIVSHGEISKIHRLAKLKPMIVINGHTRGGVYSVYDVPVVLTNGAGLVLIEIKQNAVKTILEYQTVSKYKKIGMLHVRYVSIHGDVTERDIRIDDKYHSIKKLPDNTNLAEEAYTISNKPRKNKQDYEWLKKPQYKSLKKIFIPY